MSIVRWPAILILVGALAAMVALDRSDGAAGGVAATAAPLVGSGVGDADALSSVWYCAGGTIVADGFADHELLIGNPTGAAGTAELQVIPVNAPNRIDLGTSNVGDPAAEAVVRPPEAQQLQTVAHVIDLAPRSVTRVRVADIDGVGGEYASVLVESGLGGLVVEHRVVGSAGASTALCASASSASWHFAAGSTRKGAREVIVVFNPFPGDAIIDVTFSVDGRTRSPEAYEGLVVRAGSLLPIDITAVVTLSDVVSSDIVVRAGRVVVDRLLEFDGTEGPAGLSVAAGSLATAAVWTFPGWGLDDAASSIVVHNPSPDEEAVVDVEFWPAVPTDTVIEPVRLTIRPGHSEVAVLDGPGAAISAGRTVDGTGRIDGIGGYWIVVRRVRGPDVIAERFVVATADQASASSAAAGVTVAATRHLMVVDRSTTRVAIAQPATDRIARVVLRVFVDGSVLEAAPVELPGGGRIVVDLQSISVPPNSVVVVESTEPVFVEQGADVGGGITWSPAAPVRSTVVPTDVPLQ